MRRVCLLLAQFGSFAMVFVSIFFALLSASGGEFLVALYVGIGGTVYWTAMFFVFGAVSDYLREKEQQVGVKQGAPETESAPLPWNPGLGRPDSAEEREEPTPLSDVEKWGPPGLRQGSEDQDDTRR